MTERDERLREIRGRYEASTPGEWTAHEFHDGSAYVDGLPVVDYDQSISFNDAEFIAHAHQDIPYLLSEIERLERLLARERQTTALSEMMRDDVYT